MLLLEGVPHQVIEGILLAVNTLQAEAVIVYLPAEATLARERLRYCWTNCSRATSYRRTIRRCTGDRRQ